jgi:hypothetical protein
VNATLEKKAELLMTKEPKRKVMYDRGRQGQDPGHERPSDEALELLQETAQVMSDGVQFYNNTERTESQANRFSDNPTHRQLKHLPQTLFLCWLKASLKEMVDLEDMGACTPMPETMLSKEDRECLLPCTVRYKVKRLDGLAYKLKVRWCARGDYQTHIGKATSPVCSVDAFRMQLQMATQAHQVCYSYDKKSAFAQTPVSSLLFVQGPHNWHEIMEQDSDRLKKFMAKYPDYRPGDKIAYKLHSQLYGTKTASKDHYDVMVQFMSECGFVQANSEPSFFIKYDRPAEFQPLPTHIEDQVQFAWTDNFGKIKRDQHGQPVLRDYSECKALVCSCLFVDDECVRYQNEQNKKRYEKALFNRWSATAEGPTTNYIGFQVSQQGNRTLLHQHAYCVEMLERFGYVVGSSKGVPTPYMAGFANVKQAEQDEDVHQLKKFQEMLGSLMYLTRSRVDLCFAVSHLAKCMARPTVPK